MAAYARQTHRAMSLHRFLHLLNLLLAAALIVGTAAVADALPDRLPQHFGLDGRADDWTATSAWSVWLLPAVGLATAALLYGCAWLLPRFPQSINLPGVAFTSLSPKAQAHVIGTLRTTFYAFATGGLVLFGALQRGTFAAARTGQLPPFVLVILLTSVVASVLVLPILLYRVGQQARLS